jgi:succinoglycan biosynthesis transport protein ExoP
MAPEQNDRIVPIQSQNRELVETYSLDTSDEGGLDFQGVLEILQRRFWLVAGITATIASLALLKPLTTKPNYSALFEIFVEPVTIETKVASKESKNSTNEEEIVSVKLDDVQLKVLKSKQILEPVAKTLQTKYPYLTYEVLLETLVISTNKTENLLTVTYTNNNLQQVKDTIEAVAQAYMKYSLETRQTGANRGIKFLDEQIPLIQTQAQKLQEKIQDIRQANDFIDPRVKAYHLSLRLDGLIKQQQDVRAKISETQSYSKDLAKEIKKDPSNSDIALAVGTAYYKELRDELGKINLTIAQKSTLFSDNNEEIIRLKNEKDKIINLINIEGSKNQSIINKKLELLQKQEKNYTLQIQDLQQEIKNLSVFTRQYDNILRELDLIGGSINQFVVEKERLRVYAAQKSSPWSLLTPPTKPEKNAVSIAKFGLLGTVLGFLSGLGFVLIIDKQKGVINTLREIKDLTKIPVIGKIPFNKQYKNLTNTKNKFSLINFSKQKESDPNFNSAFDDRLNTFSFMEEFDFVYANLGFRSNNTSIRSLAISSTTPGEGKSTVAINLAMAVAALGKKVLLVNADLRSSNDIYDRIVSKSDLGLSDYLALKRIDVHSLIRPSLVDRHLFVMTSGWVTNSSFRLIASDRMRTLMQQLHEDFDLVIYDTSSLIGYADVNVLAGYTDGIALVTALGKLKKNLLQEALEQLNLSRIPILGLVVNQVN